MELDPEKFSHITQFEERMKRRIPIAAYDYVESGADDEITKKRNILDYQCYQIVPRMLTNVSSIDTRAKVLGFPVSMPICVAPTAYQRLYHNDGELANAKATSAMGTIWTMSTMANTSIAEVASQVPNSLKWHQLYVFKRREVTKAIVKKVVENGFKALVLTVDAPVPGKRRSNAKNPLFLPPGIRIPNMKGEESGKDLISESNAVLDDSLDWTIISWLMEISGLPVVVKGVLTGEDAELAIKHGAAAIWVSNHGGRQLDYTTSTISVLKEIVERVDGRVEVYVDGGVRTGAQVFIALALGATAVFVGRPVVWGLACAGEAGVRRVLTILKEELTITMALSGCSSIQQITPAHVKPKSFLSRI